jgi:hypothetical protein
MTMPKLTAEASLYRTSGHYQTGRQVINLPTLMMSAINPAMMGEDIEVPGCRVGYTMWEDAGDWGCIPDRLLSGGGGGRSGVGGEPSGGGGGGGGGTQPPPLQRKCRAAKDSIEARGVEWRQKCPGSEWDCCESIGDKCVADCVMNGTQDVSRCQKECRDSQLVCMDGRNPFGPRVCS